jgi:hypothetical protein
VMTLQITCDHCAATFTPSETSSIAIFGPGEARYACPECRNGTGGLPPQEPITEDLPGIDHLEYAHNKDRTMATCWFTNDAQLRFRETVDGWLREEVFRPDPETMYESIPIGRVDVDDGQTACHCLVEKLAVYENYSTPMLRRNWPHVAAVVLDP